MKLVGCRFLPDGTFLYRTSPEVLVKVERSLRAPFVRSRADEGVQKGRYLLLVRPNQLQSYLAHAYVPSRSWLVVQTMPASRNLCKAMPRINIA